MTTEQAYRIGYRAAYRGHPYEDDLHFAGITTEPVRRAYADGYDAGECDRPSLEEITFDMEAEARA